MEREQTTIRLPAEVKEKLLQEADKRAYTLKDLVVLILWAYIRQNHLE